MTPNADLPPPETPEVQLNESPRKRVKRVERERKRRERAEQTNTTEQPEDELEQPEPSTTDPPPDRLRSEVLPTDDEELPPPQPLARRTVGEKTLPGTKAPVLAPVGRGK